MATSSAAPRKRIHFIPLESNPDVFTELIHSLGVSKSLCFQDVLSLDDPDLLAFLPRPALALVLVFPTTVAYRDRVSQISEAPSSGTEEEEDVVYFKQTINNACGLYALLHAVCNGDAREKLDADSTIARLRQAGASLSRENAAIVLENDKRLEQAYAGVASKGDTAPPANPEEEVEHHYVCFVKSHGSGHLYQLDGDRKGPIDLGPMGPDEDMLSKKALDAVRVMIAEEEGNVGFGLMALVPSDL